MRYIRTLIVGWMSPMQKQSSQGTYIPCLGHSGHGVNSWRWRRDRPKRRDKVSSSSVVRHSSRTSLWETVTGVHLFTLCKFHVRTWQACNGCWNHSHYLTSRSAVDPWVCDILSANPIGFDSDAAQGTRCITGRWCTDSCLYECTFPGRQFPGSHHDPCNVRPPTQKLGLAYYSGRKQARVVLCATMHDENVCYCLNMR